MNSELIVQEKQLFDEKNDCNQYRVQYIKEKNIFRMQFAEYIKEDNVRNIHYSFDFIADDFKSLFKNMVLCNYLYEDENNRDLISEVVDDMDKMIDQEEL